MHCARAEMLECRDAHLSRRGLTGRMDLHPDEQIVFEGHPSWRAVLSFYLGGLVGCLIVGAIVFFARQRGARRGRVRRAVRGDACWWASSSARRPTTCHNQRLYIRHGIISKHVQQTRSTACRTSTPTSRCASGCCASGRRLRHRRNRRLRLPLRRDLEPVGDRRRRGPRAAQRRGGTVVRLLLNIIWLVFGGLDWRSATRSRP